MAGFRLIDEFGNSKWIELEEGSLLGWLRLGAVGIRFGLELAAGLGVVPGRCANLVQGRFGLCPWEFRVGGVGKSLRQKQSSIVRSESQTFVGKRVVGHAANRFRQARRLGPRHRAR